MKRFFTSGRALHYGTPILLLLIVAMLPALLWSVRGADDTREAVLWAQTQVGAPVNVTQWGGTAPVTTALSVFPTSQTFTGVSLVGAALHEQGPRWSKVSTPAVSTQASASIAAEAGVRHVADSVCFSAGSTTAPALTKLTVNLRDGATGAGTIITSWTVVIPAATGQNVAPVCHGPLHLTGTTNTAMTAEFSALLTNLFQDVTLIGFNVQ